ncbi:zinc-ribbon domain-containing protein [Ideonella azotifigens]|uniref:zinc-ribbon domain-containing protein n=1 Tax=Ideonella azotifigens TaxID=513160 RepID=UPI001144F1B2|nr:zinc-ribbon domain-containing protein [Ideonella azotifigens]
MSLATRCPACGTVFRVVQDQLKVSQGWVRCGQCHEVFNALEGLFELPPQPPVAPPPVPAHGFGPSIVDRSTFGATSAATQAVNTASATSAQAPMPQSSSVVFTHESGIHVDGLLKDPLNYQGFDPAELGRQHTTVLGKHSGSHAVQAAYQGLGLSLAAEQVPALLERIRGHVLATKRTPGRAELLQFYQAFQPAL